jgi:pimeloyl-ACP methyl ester carboxylesterase
MIEYPVFIPHGPDHLGAVITLPDEEPLGAVMLITGTGAPRSHRFKVWTRTARELADRGIASIRLDYKGIGDSTGGIREVALYEAAQDALSAIRFTIRALGVDRVAVAGNCSGAVTALMVAAEIPECIGALCILPRVLDPSPVNRLVIGARRWRVASFVRKHPTLSRLVEPIRGRKGRPNSSVQGPFDRAIRKSRLFFLYSVEDRDSYNEKSEAFLQRMLEKHSVEDRTRFEMRVLPKGALSGFDSLDIQELAIRTVVDWMTDCFAPGAGASVPARERSAASDLR